MIRFAATAICRARLRKQSNTSNALTFRMLKPIFIDRLIDFRHTWKHAQVVCSQLFLLLWICHHCYYHTTLISSMAAVCPIMAVCMTVINWLTLVMNLRPVYACFWQILIATDVHVVKSTRYAACRWSIAKHKRIAFTKTHFRSKRYIQQ